MIKDTVAKIESAIETIESADPKKKAELLRLLAELKKQVAALGDKHAGAAGSVAGFAGAAAYEAVRRPPSPELLKYALDALSFSVGDFERSHPKLVSTVNELCRELTELGI